MWMVWVGAGIVLGVLLKSLYNRTPLHDQGFSINRFSSPETLETVARVLHSSGIASVRPQMRLDSAEVRRIIFPGGKIMNWTADELSQRLGVDNAHAFVVRNPDEAARLVTARLNRAGLHARVIPDFDKSVRPGTMHMVVIEGESTGLIFRRDVKRMGGPRPKRYSPQR
jgi:hypothetical protein